MAASSRWRADARIGSAHAWWLILAAVLAACGSQPPPSTTAPSRIPTACVGLLAAQCEQALAAVAVNLPGMTPSYVAISRKLCDGPCPGSERGVWIAGLWVEFSDGRKPMNIHIEVDGATVLWEDIPSAIVQVTPRSPRLAAPTIEFTLGHCGLASGIDVDGSFWDPVGMIDPDRVDLINAGNARFTLNSPDAAILVTETGAALQLVRHPGSKFMFGCD
jgi:hypothetical protein